MLCKTILPTPILPFFPFRLRFRVILYLIQIVDALFVFFNEKMLDYFGYRLRYSTYIQLELG